MESEKTMFGFESSRCWLARVDSHPAPPKPAKARSPIAAIRRIPQ